MRTLASWGLCALTTLAGCAGDIGGADIVGGSMCEAGGAYDCACPDGSVGAQVCLQGGRGYSDCSCGTGAASGDTSADTDPATGLPPGNSDPATGEPTPVQDPGADTMDPVQQPGPPVQDPAPVESVDVPQSGHCAAVADWDPQWVQWEDEVLLLTNEARAVGHNCDTEGNFGPTGPLTMNGELRCAARLHSLDMGQNNYFDHYSQDGTDPFARMGDAGYRGGTMGENIASGQSSPREVVNGWLDSDGHCANIMQANFDELGVGYYGEDSGGGFGFGGVRMWTQNFGGAGGWGR